MKTKETALSKSVKQHDFFQNYDFWGNILFCNLRKHLPSKIDKEKGMEIYLIRIMKILKQLKKRLVEFYGLGGEMKVKEILEMM